MWTHRPRGGRRGPVQRRDPGGRRSRAEGGDAPKCCRCVIKAWRRGRGYVPFAKLPAPAVQEL